MRLHRLSATAFGPFAGTVEVDLDQLSEAGLFLLTGATGAGKTSVLDAVCFALYGDVPGDRGTAKRLRSDQAAPGVRPVVELELTISGRRLRLVRSPAWERAKRRGTGTTTEQASVVVSELGPDGWRTLSTRLDESGHLVGELLGMTLTQFTQVAMLPQGRFQAFLRARSDERHKLLQQLFRTGRFEDVEGWLRERRRELRARSAQVQEAVADLASRVSETALRDTPDPETWDERLLPWAVGARTDAAAELTDATEALAAAVTAEEQSRLRHERVRARQEREQRWAQADAELAVLEQRGTEHLLQVAALAAARRAVPVVVAAERRDACQEALDAGTADLDALRARHPALAAADLDLLVGHEHHVVAATATLREALPRAEALVAAERRLPDVAARFERCRTRVRELEAEVNTWPGRERAARERLEQLRARAAQLPAHRAALEALVERRAAATSAVALSRELEVARAEHLAARERAVASHEVLLQVREARIESMASELAGALAVGACCPVCGSAEHPHKAQPGPGAADAGAEREAQRRLDDDKADEHLRAVHVRDLETRCALLLERADGVDLEASGEEVAALEVACVEATDAGVEAEAVTREVEALERARREAGETLDRAREQLALAQETRIGLLRDVERLDAEVAAAGTAARRVLEAVLDPHRPAHLHDLDPDALELPLDGRPDLPALHEALRDRARAVRALVEAGRAHDVAVRALDEATEQLGRAAAGADFATVDDALASALDEHDQERLATSIEAHRARLAAVTEVLSERDEHPVEDVDVRAEGDDASLAVLAEQHNEALRALGAARSRSATLTDRCARLAALVGELEQVMATWAPVREQLELVSSTSAFVDGRSPDNALQMRLSAYVLAWRLSQVVAAANERLSRMSDQRYSLEHTGRKGAGETRGGLSLLVRDEWSGEARDPVTLSGGETFVVSLALALGLADVTSREAGGTELDTLFVDEGFGSLDADTLEDVMDTLDSLREGGRVVGVVSHVSEMRDRIPVQLHVSKGRSGSTVQVRTAV